MAVAREVCALLFGEGAGEISVRSLVGMIPADRFQSRADALSIADLLEETGREALITKICGPQPGPERTARTARGPVMLPPSQPTRLFPIWELERGASNVLFLSPVSGTQKHPASFRQMQEERDDDDAVAEREIGLLNRAGEYAQRVQEAGRVCALVAGVSWQTLTALHSRIRYIGAMKALSHASNCPVLVKIEDVPGGAPLGRLAELVAMLQRTGIRLLIEFEPDVRIPDLDIRLHVVGIGTRSPAACGIEKAKEITAMLSRRLLQQSAFSFIGGLANHGQARLASDFGIRFGMGAVLDKGFDLGIGDPVPDFPLKTDPYRSLYRDRVDDEGLR
jgi:hypothetical protein